MNAKRVLKWIGGGLLAIVALVLVVAVIQIVRFERAARAVYDVPPPAITASRDSAVIERGRHLAASLGGCLGCHGPALGGRLIEDLGPIGVMRAPNITTGAGGVGSTYTDGQLARAIRHGVRADGRTLVFMPTPEHNWWPDEDLTAIVSYVRSVPAVDGAPEPLRVGPLGKVLHEFGVMELLSAETVDHDAPREVAPAPEPTARYGAFLARGCVGCHGDRLSGGRIPGAPASLPIPANLTPHETGLGTWTEEQFFSLLNTGVRPDGRRLDPFMPIETTRAMNDTEKRAMWAYLRSLEPVAFGNR
jgi:mono/diheme cytochrome c family protein